jgi:hypothetical protein
MFETATIFNYQLDFFSLSKRLNHSLFSMNVFDSVVAGVFQIIFYAKIYVNDVFLFF